jgi:hypothetical protein
MQRTASTRLSWRFARSITRTIFSNRPSISRRVKKSAGNNVRDAIKKYRKLAGAVPWGDVEQPLAREPSPEESAMAREDLERRLAELTRLMPADVQAIVPLWRAGDKPCAIARKLGLKPGRVYRWVNWLESELPSENSWSRKRDFTRSASSSTPSRPDQ